MITQMGAMTSNLGSSVVRTWLERSYEIVELWDRWGIEMKHDGRWECSGHSFPGRVTTHLKYKGKNQKPVLTERALQSGARIMDRVMIFELLGGPGGVTGALGIDTRDGCLIEIQAKSVMVGTGTVVRLYPGIMPALMGNNTRPFTLTGDGRAIAYRLGAELVNVELFSRHAGVKNYSRSGQGTWAGVCRDPAGKPIGKYVDKPSIKYGDIIIEVDKQIFERYQQAGKGPVYMDCTGLSQSDYAYLVEGLLNEGNIGLIEHLKEEGVDLSRNTVEFSTYEYRFLGRITTNDKAETNVPGLYNAGEESTFGISGAAVFGWLGGEEAAGFARKTRSEFGDRERATLERATQVLSLLQSGSPGYDWRDANFALQNTLVDYAGSVKSEATLTAGLAHLRRLRKKIDTSLRARNPWELTRCLEVRNLYDLGETVFLAALERTESRGMFQRSDYPYTDPLLNGKLMVVKQVGGKPVLEWRSVPK
jgi:succinate dehydrogenase/fumarate reductase flavoprotein subunit